MKNTKKNENKSENEIRLSLSLRENQCYKYIIQVLYHKVFVCHPFSIFLNIFLNSGEIPIPSFPIFH